MDVLDESMLNLWNALNRNSVNYLMMGGFAVAMNGFHRYTADLDILIEDSKTNRKLFRNALNDAGIGDFNVLESMEFIPYTTTIPLDGGMDLDIFTTLPGFDKVPFEELQKNASKAKIEGQEVPLLHFHQLIHTKRISNRPIDLLDVKELEKIGNN